MNDRLQQVLSGKEGSYILPFFWPWEGHPEMAEPEIEKIYACGIREICVEARPFEEFGREGWWTYMDAILASASARKMKVWILDDKRFPTGYANGLLKEKHPELQRHYLREHHVDVLGPAKESSVLVPPCKEGEKLLGIVAYRRSGKGEEICGQPILLEKEEDCDFVYFDLPEGCFRIFALYDTPYGSPADHRWFINMLSKESVQLLIDAVYEKHYEHYAPYFGNTLAGFFSDEPSFGCDHIGPFGSDVPFYYRTIGQAGTALPWDISVENYMQKDGISNPHASIPLLWYPYQGVLEKTDGKEKDLAEIRLSYMNALTNIWNCLQAVLWGRLFWREAFRIWLKEKYQTIEALNAAWNTAFWSHRFYDWDEIVLPNDLGDGEAGRAFMSAIKLDYARFNSDSQLACYKAERDIIRGTIPNAKCTTNLMGTYRTMDYFRWAREMDIVSWDCYPGYRETWSMTAMTHDLMRGLKDAPFLLMEQAPSQQNWQPYNTLKQPGEIRAQSYQSMAHGADSVLFFQMRQSVGGCEKFHSALISHSGRSDARVFRELSTLGAELKRIGDKTVGSTVRGQAAIVFDWDSYQALEMCIGPNKDLRYVPEVWRFYDALYRRHIPVDFIPADAGVDKLAAYPLVLCPVLYMVQGDTAERLAAYVRQGGTLVTGYMSGMADGNDRIYTGGYPGPLRELCGLWLDERDALPPDESRRLSISDDDGYTCGLVCDLICPEGAEVKARYANGFYSGTAAVTARCYGHGQAWYFGTKPDDAAFDRLMDEVVRESGVRPLIHEPTRLEIACREKDGQRFWFVLNFTAEPQPLPKALVGMLDLLSSETVTEQIELLPYGVLLLEENKSS